MSTESRQQVPPATQANNKFITTSEFARRINRQRNTIEQWRRRGDGPKFVRIGQSIFYDEAVVDEWISANTHASTAEYHTHQTAPALLRRAA
jgi:predicted DNA-binding transcriptional regulator AlpA